MSVFVKCYRCLVCNQLYSASPRVTYSYADNVDDVLFNEVVGARTIPSQIHYCDDGNIGASLLAGFVLKISEDDDQ